MIISRTFLLLIISILYGCSSNSTIKTTEELNSIYISNGVEQYFLGVTPSWSNFSSLGQCARSESIRFLNFNNLSKSYGLNYAQAINIQHIFNRSLLEHKEVKGDVSLSIKDESFIFYNAFERVTGGSTDFLVPKYKRISVLWIDNLLSNPTKIKNILNSDIFLRGHPVLLSSCLNSQKLEKLALKLGVDELGAKLIPAEMFSPYGTDMKEHWMYAIDLSKIFKGKTINLYGTEKQKEIMGTYKFNKIN